MTSRAQCVSALEILAAHHSIGTSDDDDDALLDDRLANDDDDPPSRGPGKCGPVVGSLGALERSTRRSICSTC